MKMKKDYREKRERMVKDQIEARGVRDKKILEAMREDVHGREASIIGKVVSDNPGMVYMKTRIGGTRIIDMLTGEQLPRIC